ncbi:EthD domain-containing protein [Calycina marina]|uniref:EthD domain-containing protein n=1 Tax=Calycina marina TaxID=1763456 RepID=A0A9P7YVP3_9HELO|nr:EthD domain-containing protein [Calycina marina]
MASINYEKLIRVSVHLKRKPGISEDAFNKYWAYTHGPLATEWLLRCGIIKYTQYHCTSQWKFLGAKMSAAVHRPMLEFDGSGDFYVRTYQDFENAFLDAEYREKIRPDELEFVDMGSLRVAVGVEFVMIEQGKAVERHERKF